MAEGDIGRQKLGRQKLGRQKLDRQKLDRQKLDEDDHDLLTFSEAGERLRVEITAAEETVAQLKASGSDTELRKAQERLDALRAAARRNSAQPINDANFEKFFGYAGKAKRNLPTAGA